MSEPTLRSAHLFTLTLEVDPNVTDVGETPYGRRRIATVKGGHFEGEELKGIVLPTPAGKTVQPTACAPLSMMAPAGVRW